MTIFAIIRGDDRTNIVQLYLSHDKGVVFLAGNYYRVIQIVAAKVMHYLYRCVSAPPVPPQTPRL